MVGTSNAECITRVNLGASQLNRVNMKVVPMSCRITLAFAVF